MSWFKKYFKDFGNFSMEIPQTKEDIAKLGIETYLLDESSNIIDVYVSKYLGDVTLAANAVIGSNTIDVVAGHNIVAGQWLELYEGQLFKQVEVESVAVNEITLFMPVGVPFTTDAIVKRCSIDMAGETGTLAAPNIFSFAPKGTAVYHITRAILLLIHAGAGDDSKFGDATELANGVVFRSVVPPFYGHLFNAKNNGEFRLRTFDLDYNDKAGGGKFSTAARRTFAGQEKNGVVVALDSKNNEAIEVMIRDTIPATVTSMRMVLQGHINDRNGDA